MEPNKILQADLLDLVFEGKNKEYGAYELRRRYNKRILLALLITFSLALIAVGGSLLAKSLGSNNDKDLVARDVVIQNVNEDKTPPPPPPPPPPKTPPPPKVEMTKFTPPVIKKDEEVKKTEIPPVDEITKVDVKTQEGVKEEVVTPPVVDEGKQVVEAPKEDPDQIFTKVEREATVDPKQWKRHLETQLQRYIEDAASQGMAPGQYTVQVRFLVERDGSIADVQALNDPGYGLGKGAVEVVKRGPRWQPGEQNGRMVRSYHTQPITFVIAEE